MDTNEKAFDLSILDSLDVDTLKAIKDRTTELLKSKKEEIKVAEVAKKAEVKQTAEQMVKAAKSAGILAEGKANITFTMNGKSWTKVAGKVSEKTVAVDMGADVDTVRKVRYIHFDKIADVQPIAGAVAPEPAKAEPKLVKKGKGKPLATAEQVAVSEGVMSAEGEKAIEALATLSA
jgi:hypothetical protein